MQVGPRASLLERGGDRDDTAFVGGTTDQLKADRKACPRKTVGQRNRRLARRVEGKSERDPSEQIIGILRRIGEAGSEAQRWTRQGRREQRVVGLQRAHDLA